MLRNLLPRRGMPSSDNARALKSGVQPRQRRVHAAVSLSVAAAVAATIGGGVLIGTNREPLEGLPFAQAAADADDGPTVRKLADEVYATFAGTVRQQNGGWVLRAYAQNHVMDECMEGAGFPEWDWSLTRVYANPVDPLAPGTWLAEPNRFDRSEVLIAQRERLFTEDGMNDEIPGDEDRAIGDCLSRVTPGGDEREAESVSRSAVASTLTEEWEGMVRKVAGSGGDLDSYYSCMDQATIPILDDLDLPLDATEERLAEISPDNQNIPTSPTDPVASSRQWQQLVTAEKSVNEADWSCRQNVYQAHITELVPAIEAFAATHRDEILQAQREWAIIEDEAAQIGYDGQPGPLGG